MGSYPGKSSCSGSGSFREESSNGPERGETLIGEGTEDGRSACSTEDSGPEKPGNSAEEKTLTTPSLGGGNSKKFWVVGSRRRKVGLATRESRDSVEGPTGQQTKRGDREGSEGHQRGDPEVMSDPVRARRQPYTRQSFWRDSQGAREPGSEIIISPTDRRAAYLVGTSRSVGRGWPIRPLPTRL